MHERSKTGVGCASFVFRRGNNQLMRKLTLTLTVVAALGAPGVANAATKAINIYGSGFSPKNATITQNDTVTWTNRDSVNHQVLATHGEFVSPILKPGKSFSFTFTAAKTYGYSDELHPKLTGSITVKGLPPTLTLGVSQPGSQRATHRAAHRSADRPAHRSADGRARSDTHAQAHP